MSLSLARKLLRFSAAALVLTLLGPSTVLAAKQTGKEKESTIKMKYAYVGCRTTAKRYAHGKGISVYTIDDKGEWKRQAIVPTLDNPAFLTLDREQKALYTVHGDGHQVSAFKILPDGNLEPLNTVDAQGKNPVYAVPSFNNRFLFVASLQGGAVASLPIREDGSLGEAVSTVHLEGQPGKGVSHAHACVLDGTGRYLLVPTQARGVKYEGVWVFQVDQEAGNLTLVSRSDARTYDEPRHLVFSPDNKRVYLVNEKGSTLRMFSFDEANGRLTPEQVVPSLQETYVGPNMASAIAMGRDGRHVYATNRIKEGIPPEGEDPAYGAFRGQETLVSYEVDEKTGMLKNPQWVSCEGYTPRFMTLTPDGKELIVANMDSDTLKFFSVEGDGRPRFTGKTVKTESPCALAFR